MTVSQKIIKTVEYIQAKTWISKEQIFSFITKIIKQNNLEFYIRRNPTEVFSIIECLREIFTDELSIFYIDSDFDVNNQSEEVINRFTSANFIVLDSTLSPTNMDLLKLFQKKIIWNGQLLNLNCISIIWITGKSSNEFYYFSDKFQMQKNSIPELKEGDKFSIKEIQNFESQLDSIQIPENIQNILHKKLCGFEESSMYSEHSCQTFTKEQFDQLIKDIKYQALIDDRKIVNLKDLCNIELKIELKDFSFKDIKFIVPNEIIELNKNLQQQWDSFNQKINKFQDIENQNAKQSMIEYFENEFYPQFNKDSSLILEEIQKIIDSVQVDFESKFYESKKIKESYLNNLLEIKQKWDSNLNFYNNYKKSGWQLEQNSVVTITDEIELSTDLFNELVSLLHYRPRWGEPDKTEEYAKKLKKLFSKHFDTPEKFVNYFCSLDADKQFRLTNDCDFADNLVILFPGYYDLLRATIKNQLTEEFNNLQGQYVLDTDRYIYLKDLKERLYKYLRSFKERHR